MNETDACIDAGARREHKCQKSALFMIGLRLKGSDRA